MNYHIGMGDTFDNDCLIKLRPVPFLKRLLIRMTFLLYAPRAAMKFLKARPEKHILQSGDRKLSGRKISATSGDILFKDVKEASKHKGVTINDFITSCLAQGLKEYFILKGDKDRKSVNIVIPANLRFGHYGSWEKVKFENKFAPVPLVVPLSDTLEESFRAVPKVTRLLREHFIDIYCTYACTYYFTMFAPYFVLDWFLMQSTKPYTLAFSNTPGLLKPILVEGKPSKKM